MMRWRWAVILLLMVGLVACSTADVDEAANDDDNVVLDVLQGEDPNDDEAPDDPVEPTDEAQVSDNIEPTASDDADDMTGEATEAASAESVELDGVHSIPMVWGGEVEFNYPSAWRVRDTSEGDRAGELTLYAPDNYNISLSANNDPENTPERTQSILDTMNQSREIETVDVDGRTVYYTYTRGGNGLAAAVALDDSNAFAFAEMVNTRGRDLDVMLDTMIDILLSVTVLETGESEG